MSVNLSSKQCPNQLVKENQDILEEIMSKPCNLKLEITESAVMDNAETAVQY